MGKGNVLIVEDDNIIAQDLKSSLERLGYDVMAVVPTGEEAIKRAVELNPGLVMMDIVLKGAIDGIKAAAHIMQHYNIPVVYLTSHSDKGTLERAKKTGSYGYILKPYAEAELRATLEMVSYKHGIETRLREREHWLDVILSSIGDAVVVADTEERVKYMNPAAETLTDVPLRKVLGRKLLDVFSIVLEATGKPVTDTVSQVLQGESGGRLSPDQLILVTEDWRKVPVDVRAYPARDETGQVTDVVLVLTDVSERVEALRKIQDSERFLSNIFDSIYDPFCIIDRDFTIVRANKGYAELQGQPLEMLVGERCFQVLGGKEEVCEDCLVQDTFESAESLSKEKFIKGNNGGNGEWVEIHTYPILDSGGNVAHVAEYTRIITDRRKAEDERKLLIKELDHLSRTDGLTGLINRRALMEHLEQEADRAARYDKPLSIVLCDIDNFKVINDTHGHASGDRALKMVSETFKNLARKADVVGRYGGDEFLLIMPETRLDGAREFAERIRTIIAKTPFKTEGGEDAFASLSLGVAVFSPHSDTIDTFVTRADHALYTSKREGRDRVTVEGSDT